MVEGRGVAVTTGRVPGAKSCGMLVGMTGRAVATGRGVCGRGVARGRGAGLPPPRGCEGTNAGSGSGAGAGTSGAAPALERPSRRIGW